MLDKSAVDLLILIMNKKCIPLFLIILVAAGEERNITLTKSPIQHKSGLQFNITKYVEYGVRILVHFIPKYGLDPLELADVSEGFEVKPVFITYSAWIKVHDGNMTGLVNVSHIGHQEIYYASKKLHLHLQLQCTDLEINYKYSLKAMNIGPTGLIHATVDKFVAIFDVVFDFNNFQLSLEEFSLTHVGRVHVNLRGISQMYIVNAVVNVFMGIFNNVIISRVENQIRDTILGAIDDVNKAIQKFTQFLKLYD